MQPLILSIPGDFWDVQIYEGRLYLWHYDGRLSVYDWEKLVELVYPEARWSFIAKAAWLHGNLLYHPAVRTVFEDPKFYDLFDKQYASLIADSPVITPPNILEESLYGEQDNPVKELPTDTEIFNDILYLVTYEGLWSATVRKNRRYLVNSRPEKCWDAQVYSVAASHGQIALSAGNEGLFEYDMRHDGDGDGVTQLTPRHSSYADWTFASVYSTSLVTGSCLLAFNWKQGARGLRREFVREIDESEILWGRDGEGLSWGAGDKICGLSGEEVAVVKYVQNYVRNRKSGSSKGSSDFDKTISSDHQGAIYAKPSRLKDPFGSVGKISFDAGAEVVKAGLAYFGVLLETTDRFLVYRSDGEIWSIPGPIVRWRTYPRSKYYGNHLHIIVQDAVYIVAFMHDYWQQQTKKIAGIRYRN